MKIFVTGGAGYLGSILVPHLLIAGHEVTVLDAMLFRQASLLECCANKRFHFVRGDCRNEDTVKPLVSKADAIIPLAAIVGAPACNHDEIGTRTTNLSAVLMLDRLRSKLQRMLMPVTNSGYGIGEKDVMCTEDSPLRPISLYGRTKVEAEKALLDGGEAITFRLATVFGASPRMRMDLLVNDFVYRAVTDSAVILFEAHFKRNYLHVRDVARVFSHGVENYESMKGRPYNVGLSDANLSKRELCELIRSFLPKFVFMEATIGEDPDKRDYIVSNERIEKTGWRPKFSVSDGIQELVKTYRIIQQNQYKNI